METIKIFNYKGKEYKTITHSGEGFILVYSVSDDWVYIEAIVISREKRNSGIGETLLNLIISKEKDKDIYLLETGELGGDEVRLRKWYEKHGFVIKKDRGNLPFNYNMVLRRR